MFQCGYSSAKNPKRPSIFPPILPMIFFLLSDFCHQQLGAAVGGGLEDSAFSASSSYDEASVGPRNAR